MVAKVDKIVKRGQIYWVDFGTDNIIGSEQRNKRPAIVISNDLGNKYSPVVSIAIITSQLTKAKLPTHIEIEATKENGLTKKSIILTEQIKTIDKQRLIDCIGYISSYDMLKVDKAIEISLGLQKIPNKVEQQALFLSEKIKKIDNAIEVVSSIGNSVSKLTQKRALLISKLSNYCLNNKLSFEQYYIDKQLKIKEM